jgi:hypothetical protein
VRGPRHSGPLVPHAEPSATRGTAQDGSSGAVPKRIPVWDGPGNRVNAGGMTRFGATSVVAWGPTSDPTAPRRRTGLRAEQCFDAHGTEAKWTA